MAHTDEIGIQMVVRKTVMATEFDASDGVTRIVLTFTDNSQLMIYGEGVGYAFRQQNASALMSMDDLRKIFHRKE